MTDPSAERIRGDDDESSDSTMRRAPNDSTRADDSKKKKNVVDRSLDTQGDDGFFFPDDLPSEIAGDVIDRYRLVEEIGRGGFGTVWLADQKEPIERRVALKIVRVGMDTREVVARFEQERQALAMMDHAHIARVLDAGRTASGRPYFVMDYVEGVSITNYCEKHGSSAEERLNLLATVCKAVQHAHGKGIIHRDLKPSNILVGTRDGQPHATVIDFGIAKATSAKLKKATNLTAHMQVIGTLNYMSPEQSEGSLDIDTRTDVYSLGIILHELLTGTRPFDDWILEGDGTTTVNQKKKRVAVEGGREFPRLPAELDWIVSRAIAKDRSKRYETADLLATDIRRYLRHDAVFAAPPSRVYRLRKFARRNRIPVAAALILVCVLTGGVIAFAKQAKIAENERDIARNATKAEALERKRAEDLGKSEKAARAVAETNQAKADAINGFLLDILGSADVRRFGRDAKIAQALDEAAGKVEAAFGDRPAVEEGVRHVLARAYSSLTMPAEATKHVDRAIELASRIYGEESVEYARTLGDRANVANIRNDHAAASEIWKRCWEISKKAAGDDERSTIAFAMNYANQLHALKRDTEAVPILEDVLRRARRVLGAEDMTTQVAINSLAVTYHYQKRLDEAEVLYREAVANGTEFFGARHSDTITSRMNLASMLAERGKTTEAEPMMRAACADAEDVFGKDHPRTGEAASVFGEFLKKLGRFKDAVPYFETAVGVRIHNEGEHALSVAKGRLELARCLHRLGKFDRADQLLASAIEDLTAKAGPEDEDTLEARSLRAQVVYGMGKSSEAEALYKDLLKTLESARGDEHRLTNIVRSGLGLLLIDAERYADAEALFTKSLATDIKLSGDAGANASISRYNLSVCARKLGRIEDAVKQGRVVVSAFTKVFGPNHANVALAKNSLAESLIAMHEPDDARIELEDAVRISKGALGADNPAYTSHSLLIANILLDDKEPKEALPLLEDAFAVRTKALGPADKKVAQAGLDLGRCKTALARYAEAERLLLAAHTAFLALGPKFDKERLRTERALVDLYSQWNAASPDPERARQLAEWQKKVSAVP